MWTWTENWVRWTRNVNEKRDGRSWLPCHMYIRIRAVRGLDCATKTFCIAMAPRLEVCVGLDCRRVHVRYTSCSVDPWLTKCHSASRRRRLMQSAETTAPWDKYTPNIRLTAMRGSCIAIQKPAAIFKRSLFSANQACVWVLLRSSDNVGRRNFRFSSVTFGDSS